MQVDLFDHVVLQSLLLDWGLSEHALSVLEKEPEIVAQLQQARSLPPFPADYQPSVIEERFDGINYRRWEFGHLVYESPCSSSYEPPFVEYCFDEQTALFHVNGEIVVNRLEKMASQKRQRGKGAEEQRGKKKNTPLPCGWKPLDLFMGFSPLPLCPPAPLPLRHGHSCSVY